MVNNQVYLFIIFVIDGFIVGLLFDFFRILRKSFNTKDFIIYIQDILFWIFTGILVLYTMYKYSDGELRFFMIIGIILGFMLYILTISKYIIKVSVIILNILKKIIVFIVNILTYPFKFIIFIIKKFLNTTKKIVFRPILKYFNKIVKYMYKYARKIEKNRGFFEKKEKYNNV